MAEVVNYKRSRPFGINKAVSLSQQGMAVRGNISEIVMK